MINIQNISNKMSDNQNKKIKIFGKPQSLSFTKNLVRAHTSIDEHPVETASEENAIAVNPTHENEVIKIQQNRIFQA